jgi:hypothetical protein
MAVGAAAGAAAGAATLGGRGRGRNHYNAAVHLGAAELSGW